MMEEAVISASLGRIKLEGASHRKNSTGITIIKSPLSSSNSEQKPLPRYMRTCRSSCHDFCKYGRQRAFEEEAKKSSVSRKVVRNMEIPLEGQRKVKDGNVMGRKKATVIKPKAASEPKMKLSDRPQITKKMAPSSTKKIDVTAKPAAILKPKSNPKTKPVVAMMSSPSSFPRASPSARRYSDPTVPGSAGSYSEKKPLHSLGALSIGRGSGSRTVTKSPKILQKKELKPPTASLSPIPSVNGLASIKRFKHGDPKLISTAKNHDKLQRYQSGDDIEKTIYALEPEPGRSSLGDVEHESYSPQSSSLPSLMSLSLPSFSSSTSVSSDGEAADTKEDVNEEKAEAEEREKEAAAAEEEDNDEGEEDYDSSIDGVEYSDSEQDGTKNDKGEISKGSQARSRSLMVHPADQNRSPQKLKFRRGRVINLQSEENGPRRLRFKQGRVVGDTASGKLEIGKRSLRRRELGGGSDSSAANAKAPAVMLRHQGVQGKKEEQGLFNDVIEVTASKLAETRKSKVKALVGAFETVISLQDSKPATTG
ncbi:hypothetical protein ACLOJK_038441 [Asimina triloba]